MADKLGTTICSMSRKRTIKAFNNKNGLKNNMTSQFKIHRKSPFQIPIPKGKRRSLDQRRLRKNGLILLNKSLIR